MPCIGATRLTHGTQVETGNPYMLFKDSCNRKSNQQNLGTLRCSNLCTEILEYTSPEETAVGPPAPPPSRPPAPPPALPCAPHCCRHRTTTRAHSDVWHGRLWSATLRRALLCVLLRVGTRAINRFWRNASSIKQPHASQDNISQFILSI